MTINQCQMLKLPTTDSPRSGATPKSIFGLHIGRVVAARQASL